MGLEKRIDGLLGIIAARGAAAVNLRETYHSSVTNNVIAFSGGVDSSLVAALVHCVFPTNSAACLGVSPSLSDHQHQQAIKVAQEIGIPLWECKTSEGENEQYISNQGQRFVDSERMIKG